MPEGLLPTAGGRIGAGPARTAVAALAVVAMLASLTAVGTSSADAAAADPVRETGVVTRVVDGDTVMFVADGASTETRIRLSGIQAFEIGECGADIATDRLTELVEGEWVELRAADMSDRGDKRPIRSIHLPLAAGGTADVVELMLLEGMGLWFPLRPEITDTADYHVAATHALREGRGIWQDTLCGRGPQHGHPIDMWVKSSADGRDSENVNGEYIRIVNRHDADTLDLSGWLVRESSLFRVNPDDEGYRFPAGTLVPPGESLVVRVGHGATTTLEHFMGSDGPIFDNADRTTSSDGPDDNLGMGDGAYLLDPLGNVREAYTYPCVVDCSTDLHGRLVIDHVEYDPPGADTADTEYVVLRNDGDQRISLEGYQLRNIHIAHEFVMGSWLDPGETLTVTLGHGEQTRTEQYWGQDGPTLRNVADDGSAGDRVDVVSFDERFVDCVDWGTDRPCPWPVEVPGQGSSAALPTDPELVPQSDPVVAGPFGDVEVDDTHGESIAWLADAGITAGCGDGDFCPGEDVRRAQMASFLAAALELAPVDDGRFADVVPGSTHAGSIGAIADAGITAGCGSERFCPDAAVTRAQMASFLRNALTP